MRVKFHLQTQAAGQIWPGVYPKWGWESHLICHRASLILKALFFFYLFCLNNVAPKKDRLEIFTWKGLTEQMKYLQDPTHLHPGSFSCMYQGDSVFHPTYRFSLCLLFLPTVSRFKCKHLPSWFSIRQSHIMAPGRHIRLGLLAFTSGDSDFRIHQNL